MASFDQNMQQSFTKKTKENMKGTQITYNNYKKAMARDANYKDHITTPNKTKQMNKY